MSLPVGLSMEMGVLDVPVLDVPGIGVASAVTTSALLTWKHCHLKIYGSHPIQRESTSTSGTRSNGMSSRNVGNFKFRTVNAYHRRCRRKLFWHEIVHRYSVHLKNGVLLQDRRHFDLTTLKKETLHWMGFGPTQRNFGREIFFGWDLDPINPNP